MTLKERSIQYVKERNKSWNSAELTISAVAGESSEPTAFSSSWGQ